MVYTLSANRKDREYDKFVADAGSRSAIAVAFTSGTITTSVTTGSVVYQGTSANFPWVGSIMSMPAVSVTAGSEQWIQNTVEISGANPIGSVVISSSALLGVSGAIFDSGDITGSIVISSAPLIGVSGLKLDNLVGSMYTTGRDWSLGSTTDTVLTRPVGAITPEANIGLSHIIGSTVVWAAVTGSKLVATDIICSTQSGTGENRVSLCIEGNDERVITYLASNGGYVTNLSTPIVTIVGGSLTMTTSTIGSTTMSITGYLD